MSKAPFLRKTVYNTYFTVENPVRKTPSAFNFFPPSNRHLVRGSRHDPAPAVRRAAVAAFGALANQAQRDNAEAVTESVKALAVTL